MAHIVDTNFAVIEVQNTTDKPIVIPQKARLGKLRDYEEEGCYAIDVKKAHLAARNKWPKHKMAAPSDNTAPDMTEKHSIRFIAHGTHAVRQKLFNAATVFQIWSKAGGFIDVPEQEWMLIPLKPNATLRGAKVYQLGPRDKALVDETFNLLHDQGKME